MIPLAFGRARRGDGVVITWTVQNAKLLPLKTISGRLCCTNRVCNRTVLCWPGQGTP